MAREFRCTFPISYGPGTPGHTDASARQGYYVLAETAEQAMREARKRRDALDGEPVDVQLWRGPSGTPMHAAEFAARLGEIHEHAREQVLFLLRKAFAMTPEQWEASEGEIRGQLYSNNPEVDRAAEAFADLAGLTLDTVHGTLPKDRGGYRLKLRKALGYTG